jgi:hypothetical protein
MPRAAPRARRGCSTGCSSRATIRTAGSSAAGATPATGRWCRCSSTHAGGRAKRCTHSTRAPSAARGTACAAVATAARVRRERLARLVPPARSARPHVAQPQRRSRRPRPRRLRAVTISASSPRWMRWPGHWGAARAAWWNPAEQDSPVGPAFQQQGRWSDPQGWADGAHACRSGCDELGASRCRSAHGSTQRPSVQPGVCGE